MPSRILLTQPIHPLAHARLTQLGEVIVAPDTAADSLRRSAAGCSVIVVRAQLPQDIFDAAPSLIGAVRHGAGVDMIPIEAATARGVLVANVPGVNANAVAEHVMSSMLQLARQRAAMSARLQSKDAHGRGDRSAHDWARARALADQSFELAGHTVGLIGYGHVGRAIARLCSVGLAMNVLAQTRSDFTDGKLWAQRVPLSELL